MTTSADGDGGYQPASCDNSDIPADTGHIAAADGRAVAPAADATTAHLGYDPASRRALPDVPANTPATNIPASRRALLHDPAHAVATHPASRRTLLHDPAHAAATPASPPSVAQSVRAHLGRPAEAQERPR